MSHRGEHAGREALLSLGQPALVHTQMERRQRRENQLLVPQTVCLHAVLQSVSAVTSFLKHSGQKPGLGVFSCTLFSWSCIYITRIFVRVLQTSERL